MITLRAWALNEKKESLWVVGTINEARAPKDEELKAFFNHFSGSFMEDVLCW